MVEDQGFPQLIAHLEPRNTLSSHYYFADVCIPALYDVVTTHIHSLIDSNVSNISFPTGIWSPDISSATAIAADVIPSTEALKHLLNKTFAIDQGVKTS